MNLFSNHEVLQTIRKSAELKRKEEGRPHEVLYFHKVDDPYSHLTINFLEKFYAKYDIHLKSVLVGDEVKETVHEPTLYGDYCLEDVKKIAPFYGVDFPATTYPESSLVNLANSILTAVKADNFIDVAKTVSEALWGGNAQKLIDLNTKFSASADEVKTNLKKGNEVRNSCDYYFGSAFYYEKELYWGVDRLHYLESRLTELGLNKEQNNDPVCILNTSAPETLESETKVNLHFYPSLNSPYTYVSAGRVKDIKEHYPVNLITRPVLPMLMRKMTIPTYKGKYIISDAAREGRTHNFEMKDIYSPIGAPARRAYSLFPLIDEKGKGFDYIYDLLKSSFHDGINIGDENYLKGLVARLDLDWNEIGKELNTKKWKKVLNDNAKDMYAGNSWGVPSFKVTNSDGTNPFYVWGQDRIWLVKEEINKRLS